MCCATIIPPRLAGARSGQALLCQRTVRFASVSRVRGGSPRSHLAAWATLSNRASIVAIADPNLAAARERATQFGVPAVYSSVETMLAVERLDAIDIATPRETHTTIARLAARHGLAILCQKPLAPTLAEAEALVADLRNTRLMVHENWRFRPHYRRIAGWLRQQRIGEIRTCAMSLRTSGLVPRPDGTLPALVRQPMLADLDRFLLMEVLIHLVDTLRFLLGPLTLLGARLGRTSSAVRGEDRAALLLASAGGAAVSLVGDFMAHGYPAEQADHLEILGSEGAITLDRDRLRLRSARSGGSSAFAEATADMKKSAGSKDPAYTYKDPAYTREEVELDLPANYMASYVGAITHFVDRLADGGAFETGPEDNLETLRIIEAAYQQGGSCVHSGGTLHTC